MKTKQATLRVFTITMCCAVSIVVLPCAAADVVFLAHYNTGTDADFSAASSTTSKAYGGARLTSGKQGYPFVGEPVSEALDLGFSDPKQTAAGVAYEVPFQDLRSGTIQFWVKTGFDWGYKRAYDDETITHYYFIRIPMKGGMWNVITLMWYDRFGPWFNFYIHDGKQDVQIGLFGDERRVAGIDLRPNIWHYVVATWTPIQVRLFIDGKLVGERNLEVPINFTAPDGPMVLGAGESRGYKFPTANALIDELRILNRPLYAGLKEIPIPKQPLTLQEERERGGKIIAVGDPGGALLEKPRKTYVAPRFLQPPVIDGDLSDEPWKLSPRASGFVSIDPEHQYVPAQTIIRAGWDEKNLYIAVECFENLMGNLKADAKSKDSAVFSDDSVEFFIAPFPAEKPRDYYQLALNTALGYYDAKGADSRWDGEWQRAVKKNKAGWTVEIAIPYQTLGVSQPVHGSVYHWNITRNRHAASGKGMFSSWAEVIGSYHSPEAFNKLLFFDGTVDIIAEEQKLNAEYLSAVRQYIENALSEANRELIAGKRILRRVKEDKDAEASRGAVEKWHDTFQTLLAGDKVDLREYTTAYLSLSELRQSLDLYAEATNRLGFVALQKLPKTIKKGVSRFGDCWLLCNEELIAAVDAVTGILCGLWDRHKMRILRWSYDIYFIETVKETVRSDERLDEIEKVKPGKNSITIVCKNPLLPTAQITKTYYFAKVGNQPRILCKRFSVYGDPKEKTLLRLTSRTDFDKTFREHSYYHRIIPFGTVGDLRSVIWAKDIEEPIMIRYGYVLEEGAANLCAVNTRTDSGLGQYFFKVNDKWVKPMGLNMSYFTATGWEMGWFATFISSKKAQQQAGELRYHLFYGDRLKYHAEVRDLPERKAVCDAVPVSEAARALRYELSLLIYPSAIDPNSQHGIILRFLYSRLRPTECTGHWGCTFPADVRRGDYPVGDDTMLMFRVDRPPDFPAKSVKEAIAEGKKLFPRVHTGFYRMPQSISKLSQTFKEHPEWILKDKRGKPVDAWWDPYLVLANWCPEFVEVLISRLCREMDYYGMTVMYLDYSTTGPMVDWENGIVRHSDVSTDFLTRLYKEIQRRGGILWLNSGTGDGLYDFGFWEGWGSYKAWGGDWRNASEPIMMRRLYERPGARSIVLYWYGGDEFREGKNYRDYTNLILSHLLFPTGCWHDPYHIHFRDPATGGTDWRAAVAHQVAYFDAMFEVKDTVWADVGLEPAWWRDFATNIEAYAFKQGAAYILTALNHGKEATDVTLSLNLSKTSFSEGLPIFVWQFYPRDPDKFPRRGGPLPENWDKLFTARTCMLLYPKGKRLHVEVPSLQPGLTRLLALTQVPVVFCSQATQETNFLLPEILGGKIEGPFQATKRGYEVKVSTPLEAEILLYRPGELRKASVLVNGKAVDFSEEKFGELVFLRASIPEGQLKVRFQFQSR